MVNEIDVEQFDQHVNQHEQPVVVDFSAQSCKPCKQYSTTFESVAQNYDNVKFVKVDIEDDPSIAQRYGIRSVPTTGVFEQGELVQARAGQLDETGLNQLIDDALFNKPIDIASYV